jgi:branched-subunit amino acid aminotransferase/4-amino-4-deoxychorismate lyase
VPADVVLIDGESGDGRLSIFDDGLLRGDGCFEAIRSYDGRPFAVDEHYRRLAASAAALGIPVPAATDLADWIERVAAAGGDCIVRVVLTRGETVPGHASPSRCVVMSHSIPSLSHVLSLLPVPAPWHPAGRPWELSGVKTISYAPNQASSRLARQKGYDDALLLSDSGTMLEGPTFSFAWVVDGILETAGLDLGILDSITRRLMLADSRIMEIEVVEGRFDLSRLDSASEAMAFSTVKQVAPVARVGDRTFAAGDVTAALNSALSKRARSGQAQASAPQLTTGK